MDALRRRQGAHLRRADRERLRGRQPRRRSAAVAASDGVAGRRLGFSVTRAAHRRRLAGVGGGRRARASRLPGGPAPSATRRFFPALVGRHNQANALAALLAGRLAGATAAQARSALLAFRPLAHRMELVAEAGGVAYYDDSKGTNVGAVVAALDGFPRPVVLIAGGRDKGGDYAPLAAALEQRRARRRRSSARPPTRSQAALRGVVARRARRDDGRRRRRRPPRWRSPATRSCCRPRAPASTCSATTRTAPRCSAPPSRASPRGGGRREAARPTHGGAARGQPGGRRAAGRAPSPRRRQRRRATASRPARSRSGPSITRLAHTDARRSTPRRRARSGPARSASIACWSAPCWRWPRSAW